MYVYIHTHQITASLQTTFDLEQLKKLDLGSKDFDWPGESFSCCIFCEFLFQGETLPVSSLTSFSYLSPFGFPNQSIHKIRWNTLTFRKLTLHNIATYCNIAPNNVCNIFAMWPVSRSSQNDLQLEELDAVCTSAWHLSSLSDALPNGHDLEAC